MKMNQTNTAKKTITKMNQTNTKTAMQTVRRKMVTAMATKTAAAFPNTHQAKTATAMQ